MSEKQISNFLVASQEEQQFFLNKLSVNLNEAKYKFFKNLLNSDKKEEIENSAFLSITPEEQQNFLSILNKTNQTKYKYYLKLLDRQNFIPKFLSKSIEKQKQILQKFFEVGRLKDYIYFSKLLTTEKCSKSCSIPATRQGIPLGWKLLNVSGDGRCAFYALDTVISGNKRGKEYAYVMIDNIIIKIDEYIEIIKKMKLNSNTSQLQRLATNIGYELTNFQTHNESLGLMLDYLRKSKIQIQQTMGRFGSSSRSLPTDILKLIARILHKNIYVFDGSISRWRTYGNQVPLKENSLFIYYDGSCHFQAMMLEKGWKLKDSFEEQLIIDNLGHSEFIMEGNSSRMFLNRNNSKTNNTTVNEQSISENINRRIKQINSNKKFALNLESLNSCSAREMQGSLAHEAQIKSNGEYAKEINNREKQIKSNKKFAKSFKGKK